MLPDLFTGLRLAIGFAWTTIVAAETVNGIPGIGGLAWATKKFQQTDIAVLCIIVIGLTAVLLDQARQGASSAPSCPGGARLSADPRRAPIADGPTAPHGPIAEPSHHRTPC